MMIGVLYWFCILEKGWNLKMRKFIRTVFISSVLASPMQVFADEIPQRFEGCYSGVCLFKDGEYLYGFTEVGNESLWMAGKYEVKNNKIYLESFARNEPFETYAGYNPNLNDKIEFVYQQFTDTKAKSFLKIKSQPPMELVDNYDKCTINDNCKKEKLIINESDEFQLIKQSPIDNQKIIQTYQVPKDKNTFLVISYGYQNSLKIKEFANIYTKNNAWYFQPCLKEESHRLYTPKEMGVRWGQVLASKAVIDEMVNKGKSLWVNDVGSWKEMSYFDLEDYEYDKSNNIYISKSLTESNSVPLSKMPSMQAYYEWKLQDNKYYKPELEDFDKVRLYQSLFYSDVTPKQITDEAILDGDITRDMCYAP